MKNFKQYFNNQLTEAENNEITSALLTNYYDSVLEKKWAKELSEKYGVSPHKAQEKKVKVITLAQKLLALAASFLLLFTLYQLSDTGVQQNYQELVATHLAEKYTHINVRKGLSQDDLRTLATEAYVSDNYPTAIDYYKQVIQLSAGPKIEDHFFLGLSYLYNNQLELAINTLQPTLEMDITSNFQSKEIINWFLGLAYLKTNNIEAAKIELAKIKGPKKQKAKELLEQL